MSEPNIYTDGVEVLAPCVYTADTMVEALDNLKYEIESQMYEVEEVYGDWKDIDSFNDTNTFYPEDLEIEYPYPGR